MLKLQIRTRQGSLFNQVVVGQSFAKVHTRLSIHEPYLQGDSV